MPSVSRASSSSRKAVHGYILFAFAVAVALLAIWWLHEVVLLIFSSALFAVVFTPLVRAVQKIQIHKWHPSQGTALASIFVVTLGILAAFFVFALPPVVRDLQSVLRDAPQHISAVADRIHRLPLLRDEQNLNLRARLQTLANAAAGYLVTSAPVAAGMIGRFLMGIVLTVYFMFEGPEAYQWGLSFVPLEKRVRLDAALQRAEVRMGKWLLGQGTLMLILGVCSLIAFALLHIRYFYALAFLMGLFNIIPVAGAVLTVSLVMIVAAVDSWTKVIGVFVFYAIYAQVENAYLLPRIMKSSVDLAGLAVIIAFLIGAAAAGVLGAIIAVPTAVLVAVLLDEYLVNHDRHGPPAG
jgi:predicted PurR-regulated permease PerM